MTACKQDLFSHYGPNTIFVHKEIPLISLELDEISVKIFNGKTTLFV